MRSGSIVLKNENLSGLNESLWLWHGQCQWSISKQVKMHYTYRIKIYDFSFNYFLARNTNQQYEICSIMVVLKVVEVQVATRDATILWTVRYDIHCSICICELHHFFSFAYKSICAEMRKRFTTYNVHLKSNTRRTSSAVMTCNEKRF